jgi:hypothetical protein
MFFRFQYVFISVSTIGSTHLMTPAPHSVGTIASIFNVIVLVASLSGSVIAVFGILVATLEDKLNINSVHGAPVDEKDLVTYYSTRTEELEKKVEAMEQILQKHFEFTGFKVESAKVGAVAPSSLANTNPLFGNHAASLSAPAGFVSTASTSEVELVDLSEPPQPPPLFVPSPTVARLAAPTLNRAISSSLAVAAEPSATRVKPSPPPRRMPPTIAPSDGTDNGAGPGAVDAMTTSNYRDAALTSAVRVSGSHSAAPALEPANRAFPRVPPVIGRRVSSMVAATGSTPDANA